MSDTDKLLALADAPPIPAWLIDADQSRVWAAAWETLYRAITLALAQPAESIDMVTAEHIGGCPFTGTPNSISSCACAWWLAHDAAAPSPEPRS